MQGFTLGDLLCINGERPETLELKSIIPKCSWHEIITLGFSISTSRIPVLCACFCLAMVKAMVSLQHASVSQYMRLLIDAQPAHC